MYNRYIPQPDGSFRCSRVEPKKPPAPPPRPKPPQPEPPCQEAPPCPPPCSPPPRERPCRMEQSAGSFLRQLLPKDLDTGDLIVILLLLLLAGDCEEDRNNALLTLVLYLFM